MATDDATFETLRDVFQVPGLDDDALGRLADATNVRTFLARTVVVEKGSAADGLYVVLHGVAEVFDTIHGNDKVLALIERGDFFGEISLALHTTRTRGVRARDDLQVAVVPRKAFDALAAEHPQVTARIVDELTERLARREAALDADD
jgi:CRP-like cAMP-binding protein